MEVTTTARIPVHDRSQVAFARSLAHDAARRGALSDETAYRAGIVVTELGTNLIKHAAGGEMLVRLATDEGVRAVEIIALDRGPGIHDVARALSDGHSTSGTAGNGLGAVRRLATSFDIYSSAGTGTVVLARLTDRSGAAAHSPTFDVGVVSVPAPGESVCGDGWTVDRQANRLRALVVDGLGHGPGAYDAARAAMDQFTQHRGAAADDTLARIHQGIRHTRGAAASIADVRAGGETIEFAGIGNVAGAVWSSGALRQMVRLNGTLGHTAPAPRRFTYPWTRESLLVMHSDGLTSHWSLDHSPGLARRQPVVVATVLLRDFSRGRDDVTVFVAREHA